MQFSPAPFWPPKEELESQPSAERLNAGEIDDLLLANQRRKDAYGLALSVHMGKILVAGGGFEPPTFGL
jgi:hypothetical protein